ncbi:MAG: pyruvate ferredoxin oxidoreductase [Anaerolineae bacterium SM23_84]|nr:MAG: pyruvate ferredoxin oxidoreductase [Anaerolineae bacterium SM23_84]
MEKVIMGNHAVSYGVQLARAQVIAAYPITPQTQIVEILSEFCADGRLDAKFIKVESEHSVMAAVVGASMAGARAFTATSSHGLALMHEVLHWAAGGRLPIVMANVNRAMGPGWNVWTEQTDSLAQRDTGWMQFYCETNQEALDTVIQAFKIAEAVLLPVMIVLDAFVLSHTMEPVDIPDQAVVDGFLPLYEPEFKLDPGDPHAFYGLVTPDHYMELRYKMHQAMRDAVQATQRIGAQFGDVFGRPYDVVEKYRIEDADIVLVTSGSITSTARVVVDAWRANGHKVGLLKMRLFRPFPFEAVREALAGTRKVAVIDRNISQGHGGIFAAEVKSALYGASQQPVLFPFIIGLGGRDVTPESIHSILNHTQSHDLPAEESIWMEVKK